MQESEPTGTQALIEHAKHASLSADVGTALTRIGTLPETLQRCAEIVVGRLDAAFARIWTLNAEEDVLELQASAGMYTHVDGPHGRVPVGKFKIGVIADEREPHLTNQVTGDPRVGDQEWARREGMVAFAGYPLLVDDELVGVLAMFARHPMSRADFEALATVANGISLGIARARAIDALRASEAEQRRRADDLERIAGALERSNQELHRLEEERLLLLAREQQARQEAQAANRAKDEFLATLSHELRTPLNAILGWTALLAGGQLDPQAEKRAIAIIDRNSRVQAQLIEDLLDISRAVTGKLHLEFRSVPIRGLVDGAVDSVRPAAEGKGVALDTSVENDAHLLCDAARMQQVMGNLLSNAVKFTPAGGRIAVRAAARGGRVTVTVTDSGAGITADFLPYVFDRFRQQDSAVTRVQGGLGLGLSIVRHVVEMHGGTVSAMSAGEGQGATFVVDMPLATALVATTPFSSPDGNSSP